MPIIKSIGYNINVGDFAFGALQIYLDKKSYTSIYIVCDENTMQYCLPLLVQSCRVLYTAEIIEIESGEHSKSLAFTSHILQTLIENNVSRNALIINLGGGVISDLGGFAASIYKRGIDFINIPTSLLAMADASVGGKTGIDFNGIKNAVGTFTQPKAVFILPQFLETLEPKHYQNGLAEIFKIAIVSDKIFWDKLKSVRKKLNITRLIVNSIRLKNAIVFKDPFDKGLRKILNFGHTIGHALESFYLNTNTPLLHGEAIVIGMIMESHLALQKKLISKELYLDIKATLTEIFTPARLKNVEVQQLIQLMQNDKKNSGTGFHFSLPDGLGSCRYDINAINTQIVKAIMSYNTLLA